MSSEDAATGKEVAPGASVGRPSAAAATATGQPISINTDTQNPAPAAAAVQASTATPAGAGAGAASTPASSSGTAVRQPSAASSTSYHQHSLSAPLISGGSVNWEPLRQRLVGPDLEDSLKAAQELIARLETHPSTSSQEFSLMLSALLPAFSSVLAHNTKPTANTNSTEDRVRQAVLEWIGKLPSNEALRPHAPHLVAVAMDVLTRDYDDNAVAASRILFDLYKTYRTLPADFVQRYLEFVASLYRGLQTAVMRNFSKDILLGSLPVVPAGPSVTEPPKQNDEKDAMDIDKKETATRMDIDKEDKSAEEAETQPAPGAEASAAASPALDAGTTTTVANPTEKTPAPAATTNTAGSPSTVGSLPSPEHPQRIAMKSVLSFRVLTECPLIVMLMFQLYPKFMKTNIPNLIKVMTEALSLRPPPLQTLLGAGASSAVGSGGTTENKTEISLKRAYHARTRELVAAQAKTLSFLTYLLRTFSAELKPYEDRLANNVVTLMTTCPRESIATRKELLVATRHLLNSDFRAGFYRHIDSMLDERVLSGTSLSSHSSRSDPTLIRPLAYTTLSDFVQHVRTLLSMTQMSKVVCLFSRVLHDSSLTLPLTTQYTAVRTLLSVLDLIYHNKDPNGQIGRDILVRVMDTLTDKLQALSDYFPVVYDAEKAREVLETKRHFSNESSTGGILETEERGERNPLSWLLSDHQPTQDSVRDIQNIIRAIIVGQKTVISYLSNYRTQRAELAAASANDASGAITSLDTAMPPPGSNEEVSSTMLKLTHTEISIIDRHILASLSALKLLTKAGVLARMARGPTVSPPTKSDLGEGRYSMGEKSLADQHREALTYFAASFTALDSSNLRRSFGCRLGLLIDAIIEDPMVMVVPRHLLGSNSTTSFEFCTILLDYLVDRLDLLGFPKPSGIIFIEEQSGRNSVERDYLRDHLHEILQRPVESEEKRKQQSVTFLQLFERILKSLSVFPDNEAVVRKHLRRLVVVCLRTSMENIDSWPESYCMLLRYIFRSISAGKFEESYKELLPLIPTVLNGLYRVIYSCQISVLRCTAIELCLTIPARLSSLLPHMNLLLRIIVPALDSNVGDLVNLGLRTLEFWVDNLNPLFLYPEMSKHTELFSSLMQALSRHLKPAPYPYGLLTLRLLGKLGGKNRQFLREPMVLCESMSLRVDSGVFVSCFWPNHDVDAMDVDGESKGPTISPTSLQLPLGECVSTLRSVSLARCAKNGPDVDARTAEQWKDEMYLWECKIEDFDVDSYSRVVIEETQDDQAFAALAVLRTAMKIVLETGDQNQTESQGITDAQQVCVGLLFACMVEVTKDSAWTLLKDFVARIDCKTLSKSLSSFVSEPSSVAANIGESLLRFLLGDGGGGSGKDGSFCDTLICTLCEVCCASDWGKQTGPQKLICVMLTELGTEWSRKHEVKLIRATLLPLKTVPRELSSAAIESLKAFICVCHTLYGDLWRDADGDIDETIQRDMLEPSLGSKGEEGRTGVSGGGEDPKHASETHATRPCDEVFRIIVFDLASPQQLVRYVPPW